MLLQGKLERLLMTNTFLAKANIFWWVWSMVDPLKVGSLPHPQTLD
jgi:hypothetical protein